MSRDRSEIDRDLASARVRLIELAEERTRLDASVTAVKGRVAELEAELAMADPGRCRMVIVGPRAELAVGKGGPGGRGSVRTITNECELFEVMTGLSCVQPCTRHRRFGSDPITIFKLDPGAPGFAARDTDDHELDPSA
jgi:hypothetical protein